jgi:hypothetical protein
MLRKIFFGILFAVWSQTIYALEKQSLDQLSHLMVTGCSLGQSVSIEAEGNGEISILSKGVKGTFRASKDEIPAVIKFLEGNQAVRDVSNDTRDCMKRYMDRIFDVILGQDSRGNHVNRAKQLGDQNDLNQMNRGSQTGDGSQTNDLYQSGSGNKASQTN